jgi:ribosomal protein S18 acetylase RimI-like enzyme
MTEPKFRFATRADTDDLVVLIERAYRSPDTAGAWDSESHLLKGPRTSHSEIARLIADHDSRFLVAEINGQIAGCCLIQRRADTDCMKAPAPSYGETFAVPGYSGKDADHGPGAYFGMFAIDPGIRAAGLGKAVLAEAEKAVVKLWRSPEMVMTVINVRDKLIEWYGRRGYALTGNRLPFPFTETSGETTRDFDLVEMRKPLRS